MIDLGREEMAVMPMGQRLHGISLARLHASPGQRDDAKETGGVIDSRTGAGSQRATTTLPETSLSPRSCSGGLIESGDLGRLGLPRT
jgi:hypothetical protein